MSPPPAWLEDTPAPAELAVLAAKEVRAIAVPLHGARAEVHDWVAGQEGSFRRTLNAIRSAHGLGVEVACWTRLTRSNARVIGELPSLLKARRISLWVIEVPRAQGAGFERTVARFGLSIPSALKALHQAGGLGLRARTLGAPRCVLGRFAARALPAEARGFGAVCAGCPSRSICPGVDEAYRARFGEGELRHAAPISPAPSALYQRLRRT